MNGDDNPVIGSGGSAFDAIQDGALRIAFVSAFCLFIASHVDHVFVAAVMHSLLLLGAAASSLGAAFRVENPLSRTFTRWDEALVLILLSMIMFKFVDAEAVQNALMTLEHTGSL